MPHRAHFARAEFGADRRQRKELQNALGIDRVWIAAQGFYARDAELRRPQRDRRFRFGPRDRLGPAHGMIEPARQLDINLSARFKFCHLLFAREGAKPLQEARSDRRRAAAFFGARQDRLWRAERGDEIMRGLSDAAFGRRKTELGPHGAIEERVRVGRRRPDRLVEPRDEREIERRSGAPRAGRGWRAWDEPRDREARGGRRRACRTGPHSPRGSVRNCPARRQTIRRTARRAASILEAGQRLQREAMGLDEFGERRRCRARAAAQARRRARRAAARRQRNLQASALQRAVGAEIACRDSAPRRASPSTSSSPARARRQPEHGKLERARAS